jgi:hypothetical protein
MDFASVREEFKQHFRHSIGEGFVEPTADRYQIDFGGYSQMHFNGQYYGGASGNRCGPMITRNLRTTRLRGLACGAVSQHERRRCDRENGCSADFLSINSSRPSARCCLVMRC